uniref:Putative heat shock protein 70 family n=1 Tax=Helianthus annuus TaxID=4232 RepID=A0A251UM84_HELAN
MMGNSKELIDEFGTGKVFVLAIVLIANKLGTVIGTTYSCVGVDKNGHVEIIANDQGNRITPSWVAFTDSERLIGEATKNQAAVNAERTIFDVKRLIGRKYDLIKHFFTDSRFRYFGRDFKPRFWPTSDNRYIGDIAPILTA